jgi:hypothetical protein
MCVWQLEVIALLPWDGFWDLFRGILFLYLIDWVLFGCHLVDLIIIFLIDFYGDVRETSCYASQLFAFGIEWKPFVIWRGSAFLLWFELELFIILHANLIIDIALPALPLALRCLHWFAWLLWLILESARASEGRDLDFLYWFCCHYYYINIIGGTGKGLSLWMGMGVLR